MRCTLRRSDAKTFAYAYNVAITLAFFSYCNRKKELNLLESSVTLTELTPCTYYLTKYSKPDFFSPSVDCGCRLPKGAPVEKETYAIKYQVLLSLSNYVCQTKASYLLLYICLFLNGCHFRLCSFAVNISYVYESISCYNASHIHK